MLALTVVLRYWFDRPAKQAVELGRVADRCGYPELWIGEMATFDAGADTIGVVPVTAHDPGARRLLDTLRPPGSAL